MTASIPENLFVLEMANNHMGDLAPCRSSALLDRFAMNSQSSVFAFKLQYRDLDYFHPSRHARARRCEICEAFSETRLNRSPVRHLGLLKSVPTAFDHVHTI